MSATRPQECAASGAEHSDGPHGPNGETQCAYCGQPPGGETEALLRIFRSQLGASRDQCDEPGRVLWDRIERALGVGGMPSDCLRINCRREWAGGERCPAGTCEYASGVKASRYCHECMVNVTGPCQYKGCPAGVIASDGGQKP